MGSFIDITDKTFGRLTAIKANGTAKSGSIKWLCVCSCGKKVTVSGDALRNGHSQSCGCLRLERLINSRTTHGKSHSRIYTVWEGMIDRCGNENNVAYKHYGGRGLSIDNEWLCFVNFNDWAINNGYTDNLTIDRINVNGNYEPNNCRWVTMKEQNYNKRNNVRVVVNGEEMFFYQVAEKYGINERSIRTRYRKGIRGDDLIVPIVKIGKIKFFDEMLTIAQISKLCGINSGVLYGRHRAGDKDGELIRLVGEKKGEKNGNL